MHPRYKEWLVYLFEHPVTDPAWHWDLDAPEFDGSNEDFAILIGDTFTHSGTDLLPYSDAQVNQGLWFLLSTACSDYFFALKSAEVPLETRLASIRSIIRLYQDCFMRRCSRTLSHLDQESQSPLNAICYMFWDINALGYTGDVAESRETDDCIFSVLAQTLQLDHPACQEAAIHGYGELSCYYPERCMKAMDNYLAGEIDSPELRSYAERARTGDIL
ncbi:hypothetical protein [Rubritalea squalenifaciens]|nr:hypothetical protein [Rubritalea squalenifaciens]